MKDWTYSIISVILISLISLLGIVTLSFNREKLQKLLHLMVSFAVGGLLGGAFLHLIPRALNKVQNQLLVSLLILLGIFIFFLIEKFLRWKHSHHLKEKDEEEMQPFVVMNLVGDAAHNLLDGIVIAASYLVDIPTGIVTSIAVALHEIPQEIGDFSVLIYGGLSPKKALTFNLLSALTAIIGAALSLAIGSQVEGYASFVLPITAGNFIYLAASDLIPELQEQKEPRESVNQAIAILLGMAIMMVPKLVKQIL